MEMLKDEQRSPLEIIGALEVMMATEGWAIMRKIIDGNIERLGNMILEKTDNGKADGKELKDEDIDKLRFKRGYLLELREAPQKYILELQESGQKPENYDPYFKSANEIIASRKKK